MKRMLVFIVAIGSSFLVLRSFTYVIPEIFCLFLAYLLALILLIFSGTSLKAGITKWRNTSGLWISPTLICVAYILIGFTIMPLIGPPISNRLFVRNQGAYSRVVEDFRKGSISCATSCTEKMELMQVAVGPAHVSGIWGVHCDDGGAIVLFLADTDVPLLHEGFFFKNYAASSNCARDSLSPDIGWPQAPYVRHIADQWYHFSDRPGL